MTRSILQATALGDAHGLVYEALPPKAVARRYQADRVFGVISGVAVVSDDTEHAALTAYAWGKSQGNMDEFECILACELKRWLWCLPPATGMATARALIKLSLGWSPKRSGVNSAGNGPCMRAPILGFLIADANTLKEAITRSTQITHTHPWALQGAMIVGMCAHLTTQLGRAPSWTELQPHVGSLGGDFERLMDQAHQSVQQGQSTSEFCIAQGWSKGPQGFVLHTVAAAMHSLWTNHDTWEDKVRHVVRLGGDTDSIAAIVGALAHGAGMPLPLDWTEALRDRPWNGERLTHCEAFGRGETPIHLGIGFYVNQTVRNLMLIPIILWHGLWRIIKNF